MPVPFGYPNLTAAGGWISTPAAELAAQADRVARALDHPVYDGLHHRLAPVPSTRLVAIDQRPLERIRRTLWGELPRAL